MVMGSLLNAPSQTKRAEATERAHAGATLLMETLSNYVTSDPGDPSAPGAPGSWHLAGDACIGLGNPACWALQECAAVSPCHTATGLLDGAFQAPPYNATLNYTVTLKVVNGETMRHVDTTVDYQLP
jgi:hypothetical protein